MKRKYAILPGMIGMGILLLTGCYGDLTGKREEEAEVCVCVVVHCYLMAVFA